MEIWNLEGRKKTYKSQLVPLFQEEWKESIKEMSKHQKHYRHNYRISLTLKSRSKDLPIMLQSKFNKLDYEDQLYKNSETTQSRQLMKRKVFYTK